MLEKEGGRRGLRWRLWNWIWSGCKGIGNARGGLWLEGLKEEEEKSEQGSGDIVLGGCGTESAKII